MPGRTTSGSSWRPFHRRCRTGRRRSPCAPSGHLAGNYRQGGQAAGDTQLPGRGRARCRRAGPGDSRRRQSRTGGPGGPDADHHRRHDPAGGRRQGGRGHHHGDGRLADRASGDRPRPDPDLLHLRRRDRPRRRSFGPATRSTRRPATRSTATAAIEIDVETFSADQAAVDHPRREHPSVDRQRADDQRRARRRRLLVAAAPQPPFARDDRRPRGLLAPLRDCRRRGRSEAEDPAARFRPSRDWPAEADFLRGAVAATGQEFPEAKISVQSSASIATWPRA